MLCDPSIGNCTNYFEDYLVESKAFLATLIPEFDSLARLCGSFQWSEVWRISNVLVGSGPAIMDWVATLAPPPPPACPGQPGQPGGQAESEEDTDTETETEDSELAPGLLGLSFFWSDPYANDPKAQHHLFVRRAHLLRCLRRRTGAHFWSSSVDEGYTRLHLATHDSATLAGAVGDLLRTLPTSDVDLRICSF